MAKTALQHAEPANFGRIAENHDRPTGAAFRPAIDRNAIQLFVFIEHISSNQKEKNKD